MAIVNFDDIPDLVAVWISKDESKITYDGTVPTAVIGWESEYGSEHPATLTWARDHKSFTYVSDDVGAMPGVSTTPEQESHLRYDFTTPLDPTIQGMTIALLHQQHTRNTTASGYFFGTTQGASTNATSFAVYDDAASLLIYTNGSSRTLTDNVPNLATPETWIMTCNSASAGAAKVYRNGVDAGGGTSSAVDPLQYAIAVSRPGGEGNLVGSAGNSAAIMCVYNRELTAQEIADLNELLGHWRDNNAPPSTSQGDFTITVDKPDAAGLAFQWEESADDTNYQNVGTILTDTTGADTATLSINSATVAMHETYVRCQVTTDNDGFDTSDSAQLLIQGEAAQAPGAELLFETDFDAQSDWHSGINNDYNENTGNAWWSRESQPTYDIPDGFYGMYHIPVWAPGKGDGDPPTSYEGMYIHSDHSDKARGGTGKSLIQYRESTEASDSNSWKSDNVLGWYAGDGVTLDEFYVECYICISPEMLASFYGTGTNQYPSGSFAIMKILRAYYWDRTQHGPFHQNDFNAPRIYVDLDGGTYENGDFGFTFAYKFRCNREGSAKSIQATRWDGVSVGDSDAPVWRKDMDGVAVGGGYPQLLDKKAADGSYIDLVDGPYNNIYMDEAIGVHTNVGEQYQWNKFAYWIKLNSAPGVADGECQMWLDDQRIGKYHSMDWIAAGEPYTGFNMINLGGNSSFNQYADTEKHHEWIAFDDFKIYNTIPHEYLKD